MTRLETKGPFKLSSARTIYRIFPTVGSIRQGRGDQDNSVLCWSAWLSAQRRRRRGGRTVLRKRRVRERDGERGRNVGRGEGEDVTQAVLGLSVRWIWHLEEQRPLTLRCGRAAACVAHLVHIHAPRVSARIGVLQPLARSCRQVGQTHRRAAACTHGGGSRTITYCLIQKFM